MTSCASRSVAVVLPPREGFGPGRTGAIGSIALRLGATEAFQTTYLGGPQAGPIFPDIAFLEARPTLWKLGNVNQRYAISVARVLRRLRTDLVEVHNRPEVALAVARRLPRAKVVLFLHNDPQSMRAAKTSRERAHLIASLTGVITVSSYLRGRLLEGVDAPATTPHVLANCIDIGALRPASRREPIILFVGRVVPDKAPDAFVAACAEALPQLPGWRAQIIGADRFRADSPETGFVRKVNDAARNAGVELLGYRDHPEVMAALSRAAIVVVPSRWQEPFGLAALEAMASGAALICSPRGGLPEVAGDSAVYVEPEDIAALSAQIVTLARDEVRREALASAGLARARLFDLPVALASLTTLRCGILAEAGG